MRYLLLLLLLSCSDEIESVTTYTGTGFSLFGSDTSDAVLVNVRIVEKTGYVTYVGKDEDTLTGLLHLNLMYYGKVKHAKYPDAENFIGYEYGDTLVGEYILGRDNGEIWSRHFTVIMNKN